MYDEETLEYELPEKITNIEKANVLMNLYKDMSYDDSFDSIGEFEDLVNDLDDLEEVSGLNTLKKYINLMCNVIQLN